MTIFPERVFSGIQPTGHLHLGNYLGAIVKFVPVGQAPQLSPALKERLQAMETKPSASPSRSRAEKASGALANAGVAEKAAKDRLIETANGKTIRLVGGFVN